MSYIRDMNAPAYHQLILSQQIGEELRAARREAGLTQEQLAKQAGIGRQKLIQVEQGKEGVALAAYTAVMKALGLQLALKPADVPIADYPQLKLLTWNRRGEDRITERDALALYERNWNLVDADQMPPHEREFLQHLVNTHGHGILHV